MLKRYVLSYSFNPPSILLRSLSTAQPSLRKEYVHASLRKQKVKLEVSQLKPEIIELQHQILRFKNKNRRLENKNQSIRKIINEKESVVKAAKSKASKVAGFFFKSDKAPFVYHRCFSERTKRKLMIQKTETVLSPLYKALIRSLSWLRLTKPAAEGEFSESQVKKYLLKSRQRRDRVHKRTSVKKQEVLRIYKVLKEEQQKHQRREKVVERYQLLISTVWYFGILGFLFYIYLTFFRQFLLNRNKQIYKMFDDNVVGVSHKALIESVLQSAVINEKVAESLVLLMKEPKIKTLMTDLFIKLLRNPGFSQDTSKLLKTVTVDYLRSQDCYEKLVKLIVGEVLRNEKVLVEIFKLSHEFANGPDKQMLEEKLDKILISVLEIPAVSEYVCEKIAEQVGRAFDEKKIHDLAIRTAVENMKK